MENQSEHKVTSIWILLLASIYLIPKLIDYAILMYTARDMFFTIPYLQAMLNIPMYLAAIFFVLRFKSNYRTAWMVLFIIAIGDQIYQTFIYYFTDPFLYWARDQLIYWPLFFIAWGYIFKSNYLWVNPRNWFFHNASKS